MPAQATAKAHYDRQHNLRRARYAQLVLAGGVLCARCGDPIAPDDPWDLGHVDGDPHRYSGPEHRRCNRATSSRLWQPEPAELDPEPEGLGMLDPRWDVPWLRGLRRPPADATWPRYMTVPHPRAAGSLGPSFIRWAEKRTGRRLRWWQRLAATRLLEVDAAGRLVWEAAVMSVARQCGKSWLLRELCLWRMHQGKRFGESQLVLHTGKDIAVCTEIQRPARIWARQRPDTYQVRERNGAESIELLADRSRWTLRAREAVYGYSVNFAAVDEAWKVRASSIDEGLTPTMVERAQPQLLLISTAHRLATTLMLGRRLLALNNLETGEGDLLLEWSPPEHTELEDVDGWRQASPHWTPKRERLIRTQLDALRAGEIEDPEEPDPEASFRAQWLNQWPRRLSVPPGDLEDLLPSGLWAGLAESGLTSTGPLVVALEDEFGRGAAVGVVAALEDGRFEVDAQPFADWDAAVGYVARLAAWRDISNLLVGASMLDRLPADGSLPRVEAAMSKQTAAGLSVFRDLVAAGRIVHDVTTSELDEGLAQCKVRESPSGLQIARGPRALIKALVWAVGAAHRPSRVPAIY